MWVTSKFVLWQPRYYNLLTGKKDMKIHDFEVLVFLKTPPLDDIRLENFTLPNSIILVEDVLS